MVVVRRILAKGLFGQIEIGFGEVGEFFVHFLFYGSNKGGFVVGFKKKISEELFVVFFEFGEPQAELDEVGSREGF